MPEKVEKLIISLSGIGGLAPRFYGDYPRNVASPELITMGLENQYAGGKANPLRKLGYLGPANDSTANGWTSGQGDIATVIGSTIADTVNNKIYLLERGTSIHQASTFVTTTLNSSASFKHDIGSGTVLGTDLEFYTVNGVRKLFYSYRGSGDIGIYDLASTFDDDWLSVAASGAFNLGLSNNHKMRVADNGFMYVLDGSAVHKIDGTTDGGANGTATANVLLFPALFQLVDAVDLRGNLWMALVKTSRDLESGTYETASFSELSGVYVWDRQSTKVNMTDFITIDGVREIRFIFSFRGIPTCFTVSNNLYTQLRIFNGNEFEVVEELGFEAYPQYKDSITVTGEMITWLGRNGHWYVYGKGNNKLPNGLYWIGDMSTHITSGETFSHTGAMISVNDTETVETGQNPVNEKYYFASVDSTAILFKKWYPHKDSTTAASQDGATSTIYSMVMPLPKLSFIKSGTLHYPAGTANVGVTVVADIGIYFNQSVDSWGTTTLKFDDRNRGYKYISIGKPGVNSIQVGTSYRTGVGGRINEDLITPSFIEFEYVVTSKKI